MKEQNKQINSKKYLPNQSMLFLKGVIGAYLVYLGYDIVSTEILSEARIGIMIVAGLFVIAGITLVVTTVRSFIRGEYVGGRADNTEEEYEEENNQHINHDNVNDNDFKRMR